MVRTRAGLEILRDNRETFRALRFTSDGARGTHPLLCNHSFYPFLDFSTPLPLDAHQCILNLPLSLYTPRFFTFTCLSCSSNSRRFTGLPPLAPLAKGRGVIVSTISTVLQKSSDAQLRTIEPTMYKRKYMKRIRETQKM